MKYRELLDQYKKNLLEEPIRSQIEQDIEKHEAISDYLYNEEHIPELEDVFGQKAAEAGNDSQPSKLPLQSQDAEFVKLVNRSIRRAFRRLGAMVLAAAVVLMLLLQFTFPRLVSSFYYNPAADVGQDENQMSRDLAVYSELLLPGNIRSYANATPRGYGVYDIDIPQTVSYTGSFTTISGEITRGKLRLYNPDLLKSPTGNCFAWAQVYGDLSKPLTELEKEMNRIDEDGERTYSLMAACGSPDQCLEEIDALNEHTLYLAYVSLNQRMDYDAFLAWLDDLTLDHIDLRGGVWCAAQTEPLSSWNTGGEQYFRASNLGFETSPTCSTKFEWDQEKYPELFAWNVLSDQREESWGIAKQNMRSEEYAAKHFASMLRYLADQEQFLNMMTEEYGILRLAGGVRSESDKESDALRAAADYIEQNGLSVYGFAVQMQKADIQALMELPEVYVIYTEVLY